MRIIVPRCPLQPTDELIYMCHMRACFLHDELQVRNKRNTHTSARYIENENLGLAGNQQNEHPVERNRDAETSCDARLRTEKPQPAGTEIRPITSEHNCVNSTRQHLQPIEPLH